MARYDTRWDAELQRQIDVPFTPEEEAARDAEEAQDAREKAEDEGKATRSVQARLSGLTKLAAALGLTSEEIDTLFPDH